MIHQVMRSKLQLTFSRNVFYLCKEYEVGSCSQNRMNKTNRRRRRIDEIISFLEVSRTLCVEIGVINILSAFNAGFDNKCQYDEFLLLYCISGFQ